MRRILLIALILVGCTPVRLNLWKAPTREGTASVVIFWMDSKASRDQYNTFFELATNQCNGGEFAILEEGITETGDTHDSAAIWGDHSVWGANATHQKIRAYYWKFRCL